jgi:hypothetical protein
MLPASPGKYDNHGNWAQGRIFAGISAATFTLVGARPRDETSTVQVRAAG